MTSLLSNSRESRTAAKRLLTWVLTLLSGLASMQAMSQERFLLEGIFDAELHETDPDSILLSRNGGDLVSLGRLQIWSAFQVSPGLQIYALGELETDNSGGKRKTESELEQFALRYTSQSSPYYFLEAGKILSPLGAYANRHLSTQNPLIGQPYVYMTSYPVGIQAAGSAKWLDYRAALIDQPDINLDYMSGDPGSAFRPALGFGVTPIASLRFGFSYTEGPYLNRQLNPYLPPGASWRDFDQRVLGFDFQFSRGYLELNGQLVVSKYDVPFQNEDTDDTSYYLELKYTWTPRFYGAIRYGHNEAALIRHLDDLSWAATNREFRDVEIGLGYRFSPDTLVKLAYRRDHWNSEDGKENPIANGHSLSLQLSLHFDTWSWLSKQSW